MIRKFIGQMRKFGKLSFVALLLSVLAFNIAMPQVTHAISTNQMDLFENGSIRTFDYETKDLTACATGDSEGEIELVGRDNIEKAYNYFVARGFTPKQAAGIIGNLRAESGVNPRSVQQGGPGRGIAQWSLGQRWDTSMVDNGKTVANLRAFAASATLNTRSTRSVYDLGVQLDFIWYEMKNIAPYNETIEAMKKTTTIEDVNGKEGSTTTFHRIFERSADTSMAKRIGFAQQSFALYTGNGVPAPGGDTGATVNVSASCTGGAGGGNMLQVALQLAWPQPIEEANPVQAGRVSRMTPKPAYSVAMAKYNPIRKDGADCSVFVATVARMTGADKDFLQIDVSEQQKYMLAHPEKWEDKGVIKQKSQLMAGDIIVDSRSEDDGHIWIYTKKTGKYFTASASWNDRSANEDRDGDVGYRVFRAKQAGAVSI